MKTAWVALSVFFALGILCNGLYYELPMFAMNVFLTGMVLAMWVRKKSVNLYPGHGFAAALVLMYAISVVYAVDKQQAVIEAGRIYAILPVSILASSLDKRQQEKLWSLLVWLGAIIVGWGYAFGLVRNGRLESTFQYANSLAMLLLVSTLAGLWLAGLNRKKSLYFPAMVSCAGLFLTSSRFVVLMFLSAALISLWLVPGWGRKKKAAWFGVSCLVMVVAGALLSLLTDSRLTGVHWGAGELQLRLVYWKDALHLFTMHPWRGTGGGGWALLGPQGYYAKYAHNQYLQIADDIGILGVLAIAGWIVYFVYRQVHAPDDTAIRIPRLLIASSMLVHAGFDIDLTYPVLFGLLAFLLVETGEPQGSRLVIGMAPLRKGMTVSLLILLCGVHLWLSIGYGMKEQAMRKENAISPEESIQSLRKAADWIPWDHSISMEIAHLYIRQWNQYQNQADLTHIDEAMADAIKKSPYDLDYQSEYEEFRQKVTSGVLSAGNQ